MLKKVGLASLRDAYGYKDHSKDPLLLIYLRLLLRMNGNFKSAVIMLTL